MRVKTQIILSFLLILLLNTLILSLLAYRQSARIIERNVAAAGSRAVELVQYNLQRQLLYYDDYIYQIFLSDAVQQWFSISEPVYQSSKVLPIQRAVVQNQLISLLWRQQEIDQISLVSYSGFELRRNNYYDYERHYQDYPWLPELEGRNELFLSPIQTGPVENQSRKYFTVARQFYTPSRTQSGYIFLDINLSNLRQICGDMQFSDNSYFILLHPDGSILWHPDNEKIGKPCDPDLYQQVTGAQANQAYRDETRNSLVVSSLSEETGIGVVAMLPYDEIAADLQRLQTAFLVAAGICSVLAVGLAVLIARGLTRPIDRLETAMQAVEREDFIPVAHPRGARELVHIQNIFNHMVGRINTLIEQNYRIRLLEAQSRLKQREASLNALQAQINPHFIYNTLEAISSLAQMEEKPEISEMAVSLAGLLRYSADFQHRFVPLSSEAKYIQTYLTIQKIRYQEMLSYQVTLPEELLGGKCLRLSIQPIVENCCKHGYDDGHRTLHIDVTGRLEGGMAFITVEDNGCGIHGEALEALRQRLAHSREDDGSYSGQLGLLNLNTRLQFAFGEQAGLTPSCAPSGGLHIEIHFPFQPYQGA